MKTIVSTALYISLYLSPTMIIKYNFFPRAIQDLPCDLTLYLQAASNN